MTVMAVLALSTRPRGVSATPEAPYIIENTLIMSTMGLPVMLATPVLLAGAGVLVELVGVGAAACAHGESGQSARALIGLATVLSIIPVSPGPLLRTDTFTEPAWTGMKVLVASCVCIRWRKQGKALSGSATSLPASSSANQVQDGLMALKARAMCACVVVISMWHERLRAFAHQCIAAGCCITYLWQHSQGRASGWTLT
jgi:hypothetical protein